MKKLINKLVHILILWCIKRGRVFMITGEASNKKDVYLVRYIVFKSKWCCLYIHRFMRSDSSDPHDHPWNFFTYVVEGGYDEHFYDVTRPQLKWDSKSQKTKYKSYWTKVVNKRVEGSLAYRRATDIHRVIIPKKYNLDQINEAPLTVCLMFKRQRHWGFWPLKNKGTVFVDWRKYLKIKPEDPRIEGSE